MRRRSVSVNVPPAPATDPGFALLFDGATLNGCQMSTIRNQPGWDNPGALRRQARRHRIPAGTDLGLLWHTSPTPRNFILKLEWMLAAPDDNSGAFIRFPNPEGERHDTWVGVNLGLEIQIDELARPDGAGFTAPARSTLSRRRMRRSSHAPRASGINSSSPQTSRPTM